MKKTLFFAVVLFGFAITACAQTGKTPEADLSGEKIQTLDDGTKYIIHPSKIRSGGPPPDGIPSIDNPKFETVADADEWLSDEELVIVLRMGDTVRMYPFPILVWHEIVNDTVDGEPILITYCPLCGSAIAYKREIDGQAVEFGTSGKLYNSNLVMYDRQTSTYWTQIEGRAIVGELTGARLQPVSINTVAWGTWKELYPDAEVLSRDTGHRRSYGFDPYGSYYSDNYLMFPVENDDSRMHPKTVVYGIEVNGVHKAYRERDVLIAGTIEDNVGGVKITVTADEFGAVEIRETAGGTEIVKERDFWFAWAAFHPDTLVFEKG